MYREELPPQCPPPEAVDVAHDSLFRAVKTNPPTDDDFLSQRLKGHVNHGGDECRFASCSFFTTIVRVKNIAGKLPKPREGGPYVAEYKFGIGAGRSLLKSKRKHVDFWFYAEFDPHPSLSSIEEV